MSAVLQRLHGLADLAEGTEPPLRSTPSEPTAVRQFNTPISNSLARDRRHPSTAFEPEVRRTTYVVPEVDVSAAMAPKLENSAARISSVREHGSVSQLLAEWHGQVTRLGANTFTAELKGRHGSGVAGSEDEAIIPLEDVREEDSELVRIGAFFRLCISYEVNSGGSKRRFTEVIFRRMPAYRREELAAAQERARDITRAIRLE